MVIQKLAIAAVCLAAAAGGGAAVKDRLSPAEKAEPPAGAAPPEEPRIEKVVGLNDELEKGEKGLDESFRRVKDAIPAVSPTDFSAQDVAHDALLKHLRGLRQSEGQVRDNYEAYRRNLLAYGESLSRAPAAYRDARGYFLELAQAEGRPDLKGLYESYAGQCDVWITVCEARKLQCDQDMKDAEEVIEDVRATGRAFEAFEKFLLILPRLGARDKSYKEELKKHAGHFRGFLEQLKRFDERLKGRVKAREERARQAERSEASTGFGGRYPDFAKAVASSDRR